MKKIHAFALVLVSILLGFSASLHAEDIDVYVDNATTDAVPNVLFVLDNGADFDATANLGCSSYSDGSGAPSTGTTKTSGVLQCALVAALQSLTNSVVNIGIMTSNSNNYANSQATTDKTQGGYHELCSTGTGGCLIRKLTLMDATGKANLITHIKGWGLTGQSNSSSFVIKQSQSNQASSMQEAWAYFNGKTGLSGTNYSSSILASGCQRNFIVYISNTQKNPSQNEGTAGITATQVGATSAQLAQITGSVKFSPAVCGSTTTYTLQAGNNYADEWARLMYQQDGGASGNQNTQNIITYTIGIASSGNQCSTDTYGLISSMAKVGGGKFFNTSNVSDLTSALETILNEVQAVNSVFSAASLPVSVNAQGTYLNQIYLGMFRPDATASPRWLGNLKQYKLITDSSGALVLGDSQGNSAISASGTGFISPTAVSFWTTKTVAISPDSLGGMFVNNPEGTPASGYDSPDGEVVEKGGTAQQIRIENLTGTFVGSSNTASTNPRRMYTYCPSGSGCNSDLTNSGNDFSTANSGIAASAFGTSTTVKIASITRVGPLATVTTKSAHGFSSGASVTLSNTTYYDGTYTITSTGSLTFTFPTNDYPNTPSLNAYQIASQSGAPVSITSMTRTPSTSSTANTETVTITTATAHGFTTASNLQVTGASPSNYLFSGYPLTASGSTLTYSVQLTPTAASANTYTVTYPSVSVSLTNTATGVVTATTTTNLNIRSGQTITISGAGNTKYNGTYSVNSSPAPTNSASGSSFSATMTSSGSNSLKTQSNTTATLTSSTSQAVAAGSINRTGTTDSSTATISGVTSGYFGSSSGNTATVLITKSGGSSSNESAYEKTSVTITCAASGCTSFTYPITVSPTSTVTLSSAQIGPPSGAAVTLAAGKFTRASSGSTVTVDNSANPSVFTNGQTVVISLSGTQNSANESAYVGSWPITCATSTCASFTYGPVTLTPTTPALGGSMTAYSATTAPDRNTVIEWLRGLDNNGDELGPGGTVTVRPSVHADVLHSRPLVVNYGGASDKIVVYYGSNDGVFHAVNGNVSTAIGGVPAGGELWGLVLPEHYGYINRQRVASPELKFPTTTLSTATTKDYFVDGPTGAYQKLNSDGTINTAYIFLTMRRGGQFMYGLDVTDPQKPKYLWKIDSSVTGFEELGQTWSRPRLTLLQSSTYKTTPVLVFGAGYDNTAEDAEPPTTDTMGRGVYIINAATGALIWSATASCTTSSTCKNVPTMTSSIPSDVTFVDRDGDGYTDKFYVGDVGGNLWRFDVSDASTSNWKVTKIAALGCDSGACASGTTPRKFFFPPAVLSIKAAGATGSYDALSIASGDREHPLKSTATGSSYNVADKFFMVADASTAVGGTPSTSGLTLTTNLFNATSTVWDGSLNGFYINFATGEKGVNQPLAVNGDIFFSTNRPVDKSSTCAANLGEAKAYAVSPFTGEEASNVLSGGGLPPSPVAGLVSVTTKNADGTTTTNEEKFCIGCGIATPPGVTGTSTCTGNAALQNCTPEVVIPSYLKRTYWFKK